MFRTLTYGIRIAAASGAGNQNATLKNFRCLSSSTIPTNPISDKGNDKHDDDNNNKNNNDNDIKKSVFISQSNDVFTNLALEDWLYRHFDFNRHHVLLLWVNKPAIVFGRFQNPFTETNVVGLAEAGIDLARRNSGGGAVYHDPGNLNCTFFTSRERYDRKYNLNILTRALFREWAIDAKINERDDIVIGGKKISGTAAKLGRPNSYHHCTLLANADKTQMSQFLASDEVKYISKATASVRSPIKNLCDLNRNINTLQLISAIGYEYLRTSATELEDGGSVLAMQQKGFQLVNPTEKWFPGIDELRMNISSWDWIIGKTPDFSVEKELTLKADDKQQKIILHVVVEKGLIASVNLTMPTGEKVPVVSQLLNKPYDENLMLGIENALKSMSVNSVQEAINSF